MKVLGLLFARKLKLYVRIHLKFVFPQSLRIESICNVVCSAFSARVRVEKDNGTAGLHHLLRRFLTSISSQIEINEGAHNNA